MKGLICENICKHLTGYTIEGITFYAKPGEIVGVIGVNGSGKTTLFRTITGVYRLHPKTKKDQGSAVLCDFDMEKDQAGFRSRFIMISAELPFPMRMTSAEIGERYGCYYPNFDMAKYYSFLAEFEIGQKKKPVEMSLGEKIRLQLAVAFAADIELLILDEPAANLDEEFREKLYDRLRRFAADKEHIILLSSHILGELECLADRVLWLERNSNTGSMKYFGTVDDLKEQYRIFAKRPEMMTTITEGLIGGRETENSAEYLIQVSCLGREKLERFKQDPAYGVRYPTLTEILYYSTKREVKHE